VKKKYNPKSKQHNKHKNRIFEQKIAKIKQQLPWQAMQETL
jgi:hypothetical protein